LKLVGKICLFAGALVPVHTHDAHDLVRPLSPNAKNDLSFIKVLVFPVLVLVIVPSATVTKPSSFCDFDCFWFSSDASSRQMAVIFWRYPSLETELYTDPPVLSVYPVERKKLLRSIVIPYLIAKYEFTLLLSPVVILVFMMTTSAISPLKGLIFAPKAPTCKLFALSIHANHPYIFVPRPSACPFA